jgi:hypothetical protein
MRREVPQLATLHHGNRAKGCVRVLALKLLRLGTGMVYPTLIADRGRRSGKAPGVIQPSPRSQREAGIHSSRVGRGREGGVGSRVNRSGRACAYASAAA